MVTVVSKVPHQSVIKQCICRNCGSTLEYVPRDVKTEMHCDYGGGRDEYKYIKCPECDNKIGV